MNQVEKDRFIRWQLDTIEVTDCPTGHNGKLQVGDRVYFFRHDPPDSHEIGFTATIVLDDLDGTPVVALESKEDEWGISTLLQIAWEGFTAHILGEDE